jgi:hypothetical protein
MKHKALKSYLKVICEISIFSIFVVILLGVVMSYVQIATAFSIIDFLKSKLFPHSHNNNNGNVEPNITKSNNNTPVSNINTTSIISSSNECNQSLWNHVYQSNRLQVVDRCMTVSGVIESVRAETDGDSHIRLKVDPPFSKLINPVNIKNQNGDLVVEPICQHLVIQPNAFLACFRFHQNINIPPIGTHVKVTGSYVLDTWHGKWAEIHPATSMSVIP